MTFIIKHRTIFFFFYSFFIYIKFFLCICFQLSPKTNAHNIPSQWSVLAQKIMKSHSTLKNKLSAITFLRRSKLQNFISKKIISDSLQLSLNHRLLSSGTQAWITQFTKKTRSLKNWWKGKKVNFKMKSTTAYFRSTVLSIVIFKGSQAKRKQMFNKEKKLSAVKTYLKSWNKCIHWTS